MKNSRYRSAFTLIELLLASVAAAMILVVINAIFVRAIHLRDNATDRVRETRLRVRAERAIRDDLQSALVSGGVLASTLYGGSTSSGGPGGASFPGYLKLTTTNGRSASGAVGSDVQQVEYYVVKDPNATGDSAANAGMLVRAITRDLLATTPTVSREETLLAGVQSLQVQFYDGTSWVDSWEFDSDTAAASASTGGTAITTGNTTLPEAIRIDVKRMPQVGGTAVPPVEVLVPWTTQPFVGATPAATVAAPGDGGGTGGGQGNRGSGGGGGQGGGGGGGGQGGQGGGPPGGGPPGGGPPGGGPPGGQPPTGEPPTAPPRRNPNR